jgi:F-type H+-transporting ATPase subunit O
MSAAKKEPLEIPGKHGALAHALFNSAVNAKAVDQVQKELNQFKVFLRSEEGSNLREGLQNPAMKPEQKEAVLQGAFKKSKFHEVSSQFATVLLSENQLKDAIPVIEAFGELAMDFRGEVPTTITSATPLSDAQLKRVTKALESRLEPGQKLVVSQTVNPDILGGIQIQLGDTYADLSVNSSIDAWEARVQEWLQKS